MNPEAIAFAVELLEGLTERLRYGQRTGDRLKLQAYRRATRALVRVAAQLARSGARPEARRVRNAVDGLDRYLEVIESPHLPRLPLPVARVQQITGAHAQIEVGVVRVTLTDGTDWAHEASCSLAGMTVDQALSEALRGSLEQWRASLQRSEKS